MTEHCRTKSRPPQETYRPRAERLQRWLLRLAAVAVAGGAATAFYPALFPAWPATGDFLHRLFEVALLVTLAGAGLQFRRLAGQRRRLEEAGRTLEAENAELRKASEMSRRRYRQLLNNAGDALFFIDPDDGTLRELNRQAEDLLGYTADEIRTLSPAVLFPGPQKRRYLRLVRNVQRNGYAESQDLLFRRKDGSFFAGAVHARYGLLGDSYVVHGVLRDVTDRKRIEQELRQRNRDLTLLNEIAHWTAASPNRGDMAREVLQRLRDCFVADGGGVYLTAEGGKRLHLESHLGIGEDLGATLKEISTGEGLIGRAVASGRPTASVDLQRDRRLRFTEVRKAGWRGFQAVPLTVNERILGVFFLFHRDKWIYRREEVNLLVAVGKQLGTGIEGINLFEALQWQNRLTQVSNRELEHSRQQLHQNLERMAETNRALERLERMKSHFLALASHELRTPLTYVLSGSEFLQSQCTDRLRADEQTALAAVIQGGRRLDGIVHDLLEVARIESESLYLARETIDLEQLFRELVLEFEEHSRQRELRLELGTFPPGCRLLGDRHHLRKTFGRLLENAVKFTPAGGWIETSGLLQTETEVLAQKSQLQPFAPNFFQTPPAGPMIKVSIRDTGVGIDPEEQLHIFDKFYEIGDIASHFTSSDRFGGKGVGLGLALVKGMIEAHGGMVWVESPGTAPTNAGSTFHALLPAVPIDR